MQECVSYFQSVAAGKPATFKGDGVSPLLVTGVVAGPAAAELRLVAGGGSFLVCRLKPLQMFRCNLHLPAGTQFKATGELTLSGFWETLAPDHSAAEPAPAAAAGPGGSLGAQMASRVASAKRAAEPATDAKKSKTEAAKPPAKQSPKVQPAAPAVDMDAPSAKAAKKVVALPSGLKYEVTKAGKPGARQAKKGAKVHVQYDGRLSTGRRFDKGKIPFKLGAKQVIDGWDQGIAGMHVGESRKLFVPPHLGYGRQGAPPDIPPNAALVFEVTLLSC